MSSTALHQRTIVDAVIPGAGLLRDTALIVVGTVLSALCAQVIIPWQPVPFTLQTLSVMLCGLALGRTRGGLSQALYLAIGILGVPAFAHGAHGISVLFGSTGGYLLTYPFVAALLGWLAERGWTRSAFKTAAAMLIGDAIMLGMGAVWLSAYIGWHAALIGGAVVFVVPEILKAAIVMLALPSAWQLARTSRRA